MASLEPKAFQELADLMTEHLLRSGTSLLVALGHSPIETSHLDQMSPPLNECVRQMLMFGGDLWPLVEPPRILRSA